MKNLATRIAALAPEKRELLLQRLKAAQISKTAALPALPYVVPRPEQRHLPFSLTDVQAAYWVGRSGLFDLGAYANIYLEYEIRYRLLRARDGAGWRAAATWLVSTLAPRVVDRRITDVFFSRLNAALRRLIERHDMLRAVVLPDGTQQILAHVPDYQVQVVDLRGLAPDVVAVELDRLREHLRYAQAPIDCWPLFELVACPLDRQRIALLVRVDPLIIDGESRSMFISELTRLALAPTAALPPMECTYRDYVLTWEEFKSSPAYQRSRDYWLSRIPAIPPAPELPLAQPISPLTRQRFVFHSAELAGTEAWVRLKRRAAQAGLSASGVALAAFVEILAAWSVQRRFTLGLIGTYHPPVHPQIQEVFGNFNTISLLVAENRPGSFETRARELWARLMIDLDHATCSGHQVLRELNRSYAGGTRPGIPIFFNSVIEDSQANHPSHRRVQERGVETPTADLFEMLNIEVSAYLPQVLFMSILREEPTGALACKWQVVDGLFPDGLLADMLGAYRSLLQRLAHDERTWQATTLPLLPAHQLAQRSAINDTAAPLPQEMLHTLVAAHVARRPQQPAVVVGEQRLTYAALYRRASQVARWLRMAGARPNTLVAVVMEKGWEPVVAVLGVVLSGAAYLPLASDTPTDQLTDILEHAAVTCVLTQPWLEARIAWPEHTPRLCVDTYVLADIDDVPIEPISAEHALAYVIYTGDSAARLKGVMVDQRTAVNTILDVNQRFHVAETDRVLALASLSSDLAVYDIFGLLAAGGTIVIPEPAAIAAPAAWLELLHQEQVTIWNSAPALLELLVAHAAQHATRLPDSLRLALLSRDRVPLNLPERLRRVAGGVQLINLGGAVEAAIWSSWYPIGEVDPGWQNIPYGRPMQNQHIYILDDTLAPRPVWVPGQVYIGGAGLAQGYWRDPEATHAAFITHPQTGERLYRTGDIGRFLPSGSVELLGRAENFQTHHYRADLRRIEATLERHPAIRAASVLVQDSQPSRRSSSIIAYITPQPGQTATADELRHFLQKHLPDDLVPTALVHVECMPLTPHGTIDRQALARSANIALDPRTGTAAPCDPLEQDLVRVWEDLLKTRVPDITGNFFDLGGNSFMAARLIALVQERYGRIERPFTFLYDPTIAYLARIIRQRTNAQPCEGDKDGAAKCNS